MQQEIYAALTMFNFTSRIAREIVVKQPEDGIYVYQVNFKMAVAICREFFKNADADAEKLMRQIARHTVPIPPGRHFRWIVLEKETLHRYNGKYGAVCWTVVLRAVLTHHRDMAGDNPLCSAAIYVFDPIPTNSGINCNSICKGFEKKAHPSVQTTDRWTFYFASPGQELNDIASLAALFLCIRHI